MQNNKAGPLISLRNCWLENCLEEGEGGDLCYILPSPALASVSLPLLPPLGSCVFWDQQVEKPQVVFSFFLFLL